MQIVSTRKLTKAIKTCLTLELKVKSDHLKRFLAHDSYGLV